MLALLFILPFNKFLLPFLAIIILPDERKEALTKIKTIITEGD